MSVGTAVDSASRVRLAILDDHELLLDTLTSWIDANAPDDRELITSEPPTYALHRWDGKTLVSHYERVGDWQVLARFNAGLQPMIEGMFAERE